MNKNRGRSAGKLEGKNSVQYVAPLLVSLETGKISWLFL